MMSSPKELSSLRLPERKPSPNPTRSSNDPTPQAIPNMVRKERNLCAQRVRSICRRISKNTIACPQPRSSLDTCAAKRWFLARPGEPALLSRKLDSRTIEM